MRPREGLALGALMLLLGITVAMWALALWPLGADAPAWLARTRVVCFGSSAGGLPDASGWTVLVVQPAIMAGILFVVWGDAVRSGLGLLVRQRAGRLAVAAVGLALLLGIASAARRVWAATHAPYAVIEDLPGADYPRLDGPAPPLGLTDQHGERMDLARLHGRPVVVTFAYAHCETVCPLIVADVTRAHRALGPDAPAVVIVTLDPRRDVPSRLPAIAAQWHLAADEYVVSGSINAVERVLADWKVPHVADPLTGQITHPRLTYLLDREGRFAYATTGGVEAIVQLVRRL